MKSALTFLILLVLVIDADAGMSVDAQKKPLSAKLLQSGLPTSKTAIL
jgi:hypothetical protein